MESSDGEEEPPLKTLKTTQKHQKHQSNRKKKGKHPAVNVAGGRTVTLLLINVQGYQSKC